MLKYTSSLLATISLALVLGCGGDETTENGTPTSPSSKPAQVTKPATGAFFEFIRNNNVASIKQQLADGVDPESLDQELQMTTLAMAAAVGSEEITRLLLDAGANVDLRNTDGTTPLATAVFFGHPEVVKLLLEKGADSQAQNLKGEKASDYVTQPMPDGILQLVGGIIRVPVDPVAAKQSIPAIAALLGVEPGSAAAAAGPIGKSIWDAAAAGDLELLQANLKVGNDINAMVPAGLPGAGGTPLHIAAMSNQVEVIEFLLGKGADVNIKAGDENGSTPLQWAAVFGRYEAVKALVETGKADVNVRDNNNATALDSLPFDITFGTDPTIAVDKPKIKAYLLAQSAKPGTGSDPGSPTPSSSAKDIWTAAAEGNIAAIQAHLDAGVDINARVPAGAEGAGATALHIAVIAKQGKVAQFLGDKGADPDAKAEDKDGGTPLHWAAAFGNIDFVRGLILYKADVNSRDNSGLTPLDALATDPSGGLLAKNQEVIANKEKIKALLVGEGAKTKAELDQ